MVLKKAKYHPIPDYIACGEAGRCADRSRDGVKQTAERLGLPIYYLKSGARKLLCVRIADLPALEKDWERVKNRGRE